MASQRQLGPGRRYSLLLYQRLFAMLRGRSFWLALLTYILWLVAIEVPFLAPRDWLLWWIIGAAGFLFVLSFVGPRLAYVQCRPDYLLVSIPTYRLAISYGRIRSVRPVDFSESYKIAQQGWSQRRFLGSLYKHAHSGQLTVLEMELKSFPLSKRWLKVWLNRYMFAVKMEGLFLLVDEWMSLSRDIELYRGEYVRQRTARRRPKAGPTINPFAEW